jgi:hypothetical protein
MSPWAPFRPGWTAQLNRVRFYFLVNGWSSCHGLVITSGSLTCRKGVGLGHTNILILDFGWREKVKEAYELDETFRRVDGAPSQQDERGCRCRRHRVRREVNAISLLHSGQLSVTLSPIRSTYQVRYVDKHRAVQWIDLEVQTA